MFTVQKDNYVEAWCPEAKKGRKEEAEGEGGPCFGGAGRAAGPLKWSEREALRRVPLPGRLVGTQRRSRLPQDRCTAVNP